MANNDSGKKSPMTMIQALRSAMDVMMEKDENVVVFGQDVGYFGGVFRCTEGLQAKYGRSRVFDTPISESGIVGIAVGMGAYGLRPVAEIQKAMYEKHIPFIEEAGKKGVQILCLQEIFNGPYFCPSQDPHWYDMAEPVPGPTTERIAQFAKKYRMAMVVPVYEREQAGDLELGLGEDQVAEALADADAGPVRSGPIDETTGQPTTWKVGPAIGVEPSSSMYQSW